MELSLFVKIRALGQESGKGEPLGTGYLLSPDRVLTARHVVERASAVEVQYDRPGGEGVEPVVADVRWQGAGDRDLALLVLRQPSALAGPWPRLAAEPLRGTTQFESRGWARAGRTDGRVEDSLVGLHGKADPFTVTQRKPAGLQVDPEVKHVDLWKGVSGAPVFERGPSRRLLGVIVQAPRAFSNVLEYCPLAGVLVDRSFIEALGSEVARQRRDRLIADLKRIFRQAPPETRATIARRNPSWVAAAESGGDGLGQELLEAAEIGAVMNGLNQAHSELCRTVGARSPTATALVEIVLRLAPLLLLRGYFHLLPDEPRGAVLVLPVTRPTAAELALAAFEGRAADLEPEAGDYPTPARVLRFPWQAEEPGLDIDSGRRMESVAVYLERLLLLTRQDKAVLAAVQRRDGDAARRDALFAIANYLLEQEAEHVEESRRRRRYLLYDQDFAEENRAFLELLRARLPALHFFEMTGRDIASELAFLKPLKDIFDRGLDKARENDPEDEPDHPEPEGG